MALSVTAGQSALLAAIDTAFETALLEGVVYTPALPASPVEVVPRLNQYDQVRAELHAAVRSSFEAVVAAYLVSASLPGPVGVTGAVTLAKVTGGGTDGSLTFTNGIITAFVAPT
jgi:hypothetical protein